MHNERKRLMTLNSRFLEFLLGHLWSVLTFPTVLFPSWSSLWLSAQLEPTLAMLSVNSFPNYCPEDVNYSLSPDDTSLHELSSSVLLDCKPNLRQQNWGFSTKESFSLHPAFFMLPWMNLLGNDDMLWVMAVVWLNFGSCWIYQMQFLFPVCLICEPAV